jgi:hypothetical protein
MSKESDPRQWVIEKRFPKIGGFYDAKFYAKPSTLHEALYPLPESFLLSIHSSISYPMHLSPIEQQIRRGWPIEKGL